ncbi:MAG: hypothetical protein AAGI07_12885, partial [Bacteroidota bacterium]
IDDKKERLYIKLFGIWDTEEIFRSYLSDIKKSVSFFSSNYSCNADFSALKALKNESFLHYHRQALKILVSLGLANSAQVLPEDDAAFQQIIDVTKYPDQLAVFGEVALADSYLDSIHQALKVA